MSILDTLESTVKSNFYQSNVGKTLLSNESYTQTPYGSDFIPEYLTTTGQKRFSTNASIPNLPKPETLYFVYFSLNPKAQQMLLKKKAYINFLLNDLAIDGTSLTGNSGSGVTGTLKAITNSITNAIGAVGSEISKQLDGIGNIFASKKRKEDKAAKAAAIQEAEDSKSFGDYIPEVYIMKQLSFELSKLVKDINKPSITFSVSELNEYNRKRLVYDKMTYGDLKITFWDVKENPVEQFFMTYLKIINNDFFCKSYKDFAKPINARKPDTSMTDWGFDTDSNFRLIDKICLVEYYMDKMMVYTYENPTVSSINFGTNRMGSWNPGEVSVTFKYEGFTNDLLDVAPYNTTWTEDKSYLKAMVNAEITAEMANFLNVRYREGESFGLTDAVSFIKGVLDAPKGERWTVFKEQALDTARQLGYGAEINMIKAAENNLKEYKKAGNKTKYLVNMISDPSSFIGTVVGGGSTSSAVNKLKSVF